MPHEPPKVPGAPASSFEPDCAEPELEAFPVGAKPLGPAAVEHPVAAISATAHAGTRDAARAAALETKVEEGVIARNPQSLQWRFP
jgi:hypothetical protein